MRPMPVATAQMSSPPQPVIPTTMSSSTTNVPRLIQR